MSYKLSTTHTYSLQTYTSLSFVAYEVGIYTFTLIIYYHSPSHVYNSARVCGLADRKQQQLIYAAVMRAKILFVVILFVSYSRMDQRGGIHLGWDGLYEGRDGLR